MAANVASIGCGRVASRNRAWYCPDVTFRPFFPFSRNALLFALIATGCSTVAGVDFDAVTRGESPETQSPANTVEPTEPNYVPVETDSPMTSPCLPSEILCNGNCISRGDPPRMCDEKPACALNSHACGGTCAADDDATACGTACAKCPAPTGGYAVCTAGLCGVACAAGYEACATGCCLPPRVPIIGGVAAGGSHTCAWTRAGALYCWGDNALGQLGTAVTPDALSLDTPRKVDGLADIAGVAVGVRHTIAWTHRGEVYAWGSNDRGQLGINAPPGGSFATPQRVGALMDIAGAFAADHHSCAWTRAGILQCWGAGDDGQLGAGGKSDAASPRVVSTITSVIGAVGGRMHSCAWTRTGNAYCWGKPSKGQLGTGPLTAAFDAIERPATLATTGVVGMTAGDQHTCLWNAALDISCFGDGGSGRLGVGATVNRYQPAALGFAAVASAGNKHTCGQTAAGTVSCWGNNGDGQLGLGPGVGDRSTPSPLALTGIKGISAGAAHTCAWSDDDVYCWGSSAIGQLGIGPAAVTATKVPSPTRVTPFTP